MLIPSGYAQVNWIFAGDGLPHGAEVTLGIDYSGFTGTIDEIAEQCWNAWDETVIGVQTVSTVLTGCRVQAGPNATGPFSEFLGTSAGNLTLDALTPNCAVLVTKQTAQGGRSGRGRMFIP